MSVINAQAGNATIFTALVTTGDNSSTLILQANGSNLVSINSSQLVNCTANTAIVLPSGTTAQRPVSAVNGMIRYNSNTAVIEAYANNTWTSITS